jgi:hypothetical protein
MLEELRPKPNPPRRAGLLERDSVPSPEFTQHFCKSAHMAEPTFSDEQLLGYLDEMLPVDEMAAVEKALRSSDALKRRAAGLSHRRDGGVHSVGEIWRRLRLSCPSRGRLGSLLLGTLDKDASDYIEFHVRTIGCRICAANLADIEQSLQSSPDTDTRRRKFYQSSAGYLKK